MQMHTRSATTSSCWPPHCLAGEQKKGRKEEGEERREQEPMGAVSVTASLSKYGAAMPPFRPTQVNAHVFALM